MFQRNFNFECIESEKCVFVGIVNGFKVYLALYVDDGLVVCENQEAIDKVLLYITSYIAKVIAKFGIENANLSSVPAEPGLHLSKNVCNEKNDCMPYRKVVGSLLFTARICRLDIEYTVNYSMLVKF